MYLIHEFHNLSWITEINELFIYNFTNMFQIVKMSMSVPFNLQKSYKSLVWETRLFMTDKPCK